MTQRGPGSNNRQTIELHTTRQDTEKVGVLDRAQRTILTLAEATVGEGEFQRPCMYSIQCADALADLQHRVGCRLAQVADRYSCMTACLDQVHILMQIAYGSTNADKIVVRLRPSYSVMRWLAMYQRRVRTYVEHALRALSCFMPFASVPCSALHYKTPG